jgi:GTPase Era involved in 16S rRNA processing
MADIIERKQKLFEVVDGYAALLEHWGENEKNRKEALISMRKVVERGRYHIALIGSVKRGKSTLLNALLGDEKNPVIAPARVDTCTAAIVKYSDSALYPETPGKEGAIIHFYDRRNPAYIEKDDVSRYVDQNNGGFVKSEAERIDRIEIYGNFPLVETRGVIVDTPGMGALYDQDYLATGILPDVDVIISPIAADLPLDRTEIVFLTGLSDQEKQKLMFVLTKTDDVGSDKIAETIADVQNKISAIVGGSPRLFKTAALKVVKAREQGKAVTEVEAIKSDCGVKELETALDEKLRTGSGLDEQIRRLCNTMEDDLVRDKTRLTENKESLSLEATNLEQRKKELESLIQTTKTNFDKNTSKLKREWGREVERFTAKLETKVDAISDRLTATVEGENLLSLIGYSSKLERKIQGILRQELSGEIADMNDKLASRVEAFAEQLRQENDTEIEVYGRTGAGNSVKSEINTLIGGGIAVGGGLWGVTTALGAIGAIGGAAGELAAATAATSAATSAAANAGLIAKIFHGLFGASKAVTTATTAGALAQGGLVSALVGGVIPIVGGIVVTKLAYQFGTNFAKDKAVKNIPLMVEKQLNESIRSIESSAQKILDAVLSRFKSDIDDVFAERKNELDSIIESLKNLNKEAKLREIDRDLQEIGKLSTALNRVG